jgi:hypothetical protein
VVVLPDRRDRRRGRSAETGVASIHFEWGTFHCHNGQVSAFDTPRVTFRVGTTYHRGARVGGQSAYGRGTTAEDVAAGTTTLGFHEGQHGQDVLDFIRAHPPPVFQGTVGMSCSDFPQAQQQYEAEVSAYGDRANDASEAATDCVGTTIDQFNEGERTRAQRAHPRHRIPPVTLVCP